MLIYYDFISQRETNEADFLNKLHGARLISVRFHWRGFKKAALNFNLKNNSIDDSLSCSLQFFLYFYLEWNKIKAKIFFLLYFLISHAISIYFKTLNLFWFYHKESKTASISLLSPLKILFIIDYQLNKYYNHFYG